MRARLQAGLGVGARWLLLAFWLAHLAAARTRASGDDEDLLPGKRKAATSTCAPAALQTCPSGCSCQNWPPLTTPEVARAPAASWHVRFCACGVTCSGTWPPCACRLEVRVLHTKGRAQEGPSHDNPS